MKTNKYTIIKTKTNVENAKLWRNGKDKILLRTLNNFVNGSEAKRTV